MSTMAGHSKLARRSDYSVQKVKIKGKIILSKKNEKKRVREREEPPARVKMGGSEIIKISKALGDGRVGNCCAEMVGCLYIYSSIHILGKVRPSCCKRKNLGEIFSFF